MENSLNTLTNDTAQQPLLGVLSPHGIEGSLDDIHSLEVRDLQMQSNPLSLADRALFNFIDLRLGECVRRAESRYQGRKRMSHPLASQVESVADTGEDADVGLITLEWETHNAVADLSTFENVLTRFYANCAPNAKCEWGVSHAKLAQVGGKWYFSYSLLVRFAPEEAFGGRQLVKLLNRLGRCTMLWIGVARCCPPAMQSPPASSN